jgi:hypothetical protein
MADVIDVNRTIKIACYNNIIQSAYPRLLISLIGELYKNQLMFNANSSNASAISWREQILSVIPNLVAFWCILILYGGLDEGPINTNFLCCEDDKIEKWTRPNNHTNTCLSRTFTNVCSQSVLNQSLQEK